MFNKIDAPIIKSYIENYAFSDDCHSMNCSVEHVLRFWQEAKSEYLYKMFGNELILSKEIEFEMSLDALVLKMESWECCKDMNPFRTNFCRFIDREFCDPVNYKIYDALQYLLSMRALAANVYNGPTFSLSAPNGKEVKIQEGCKTIKALGKIAKYFNIEDFESFRLAHSQALNQKKLTGKLCLSIHPLDYMTASDNDYDRSSCMNWVEHGEYRQGTVEMMNSPMVVIAYLAGENSFEGASNKKWREFFIVNKDIITGVKGYPYEHAGLEKEVCSWLKELAISNLGWNYIDEYIKYKFRREEFQPALNRNLKITFLTDYMYNDFGGLCESHAFVNADIPEVYQTNYSGYSECMCCGECVNTSLASEDLLVCDDCEPIHYCHECGERIYGDQGIFEDNCWYCEYCYDSIYNYECEDCGTIYREEDINRVMLAKKRDDGSYDLYTYACAIICNSCLSHYKIVDLRYSNYFWEMNCFAIEVSDVPDWEMFGYDSLETFTKDYIDGAITSSRITRAWLPGEGYKFIQ